MLRLLLNKGLNPNLQDHDGNTALHYAIAGKILNSASLLIEREAKEDIENNDGLTAW